MNKVQVNEISRDILNEYDRIHKKYHGNRMVLAMQNGLNRVINKVIRKYIAEENISENLNKIMELEVKWIENRHQIIYVKKWNDILKKWNKYYELYFYYRSNNIAICDILKNGKINDDVFYKVINTLAIKIGTANNFNELMELVENEKII